MSIRWKFLACLWLAAGNAFAQDALPYQTPPAEILQLADVQRPPTVVTDSRKQHLVLFYRDNFKSLAELSDEELRLGGLRVNPRTNIASTTTYFTNLQVQSLQGGTARQVAGLPATPRLANFAWSPDERWLAFTHTTRTGVEAWVLELATGKAMRLTEARVNGNAGNPLTWFRDNQALLVRMLPAQRPALLDTTRAVPTGPTVSVSDGSKAQNRTYQDLLKNPSDESNFAVLTTSELHRVPLKGRATLWRAADMYTGESFSPDGRYVLLHTLKKPFSYLVPYGRFPYRAEVVETTGKPAVTVVDAPLAENLPKGFMAVRAGRRDVEWRADQPATLVWAEALDKGDPANEVPFRDEAFAWQAPFSGAPQSLFKTVDRMQGILWGDDTHAIVTDYWWNTRHTRTYVLDPSKPGAPLRELVSRSYQDQYSDPGQFETRKNASGETVLALDDGQAHLIGEGFTPEGQFPFIDRMELATGKKERLYTSRLEGQKESIQALLDPEQGTVLVRIESPTEFPNYYVRHLKQRIAPVPVTRFENPFKALQGVYKEVLTYKRADGLPLTGTLYLPAGYDRTTKREKLPLVMWAYPTEYKDRDSAGQNTTNPNEFIFPSYGSPVYWVARGYAVLDDAAFPIVGEGKDEPNDTFIKQLVANAKAAIDAVDGLGYIDRARVAVGGHSYGAFMTANLLTHSDLFAAGIARSGAYNRTLTPFGFQQEERNYWEAPGVYNDMSPFMHVEKMKTPLLLVHGEADNNSGTFTMQSERYFNALKGFGAPTRLVLLPKESHGYAAKESVLHLLWEQDQWLERYVKNKGQAAGAAPAAAR
ncbi:prolyl oligopeptidase family serine peptidase [Pseudoxanthomonas sp. LjRoot125]|uniref:S9 family peptidase n=1 Tax=Pseudoxanthomonas sp. LjRoot125 TaxID=3342258 RepID=UPI003E1145C5